MVFEAPQAASSKEKFKDIEISLATPEDFGEVGMIEFNANRAMHERESIRQKGIPTPQDIDIDYKEIFNPENIERGEDRWRNLPENPNQRFFVAKENGKIIGFCIVDKYSDRNQINGIYIDPDSQGQGLGKKFWEKAVEFLDPEKDTVVMVLPYNLQAIAYYKSLGFEETGRKANDGDGHRMKSGAIMPVPIEMLKKVTKTD